VTHDLTTQTQTQAQAQAQTLAALHQPGRPLVLVNAWDAGSALAVVAGGGPVVATSSWSVAAAHGRADGEELPLDLVLGILACIVAAVDVPVTADLEAGFGDDPDAVAATVTAAIGVGVVGCNLEDGLHGGGVRAPAAQAERIAAARHAADAVGVPVFVNARTDLFLQTPVGDHDGALLEEALDRAEAYADAGADGIFLPGLEDAGLIAEAVKRATRPVNIMVTGGTPPLAVLADLGVARVSHGPHPYLAAMAVVEERTRTERRA
jgi:2-methylisocitrate lyase-like PEP mutase family enzyme